MPKSTSVSCIYWDLAKRQINNSCPKVHYCTKNVPSIDDIEKHVHIKSPTIAGIKSIERSLAKIGIHLPKDISTLLFTTKHLLGPVKNIEIKSSGKKSPTKKKVKSFSKQS